VILAEVNADPAMKDVHAPPELYDEIIEKIHEHEKQKVYDQLSEEDREYLRVGKAYMKRRRLNRYVILVAAVVFVLAFGTVSIGEREGLFSYISKVLDKGERTFVDSDEAEPVLYSDEDKVYEDVEKTYGFVPVKLGYLPENTEFHEATLSEAIQCINIIYETSDETSLIYVIRPNYREGYFGTVIENEKRQEYQLEVKNIDVMLTEYSVAETSEKQWSVSFSHEDVIYMIRISDMEQEEVEKIAMNLVITQ